MRRARGAAAPRRGRAAGAVAGAMAGAVATALVAATVAAGCGVSGNDELQEIRPDDLFGLDQTTTSSTTTTTTTPATTTTIATNTTLADTSTSIATESVELFFLDGSQLVSVSRDLSSPTSLSRVLAALEAGPPPGDVGLGLRSVLPPGVVNRVTDADGVATVDLNGEVFSEIETIDELPAFAQIVLTLTRQRGIGMVRFTIDDRAAPVRRRDNLLTRPGEPVSRDDYVELLETTETVPPDTTPPDTTPPDTVPPETTPPETTAP